MSSLRDGSVAVQVFLTPEAYQRLVADANRELRRPYQQASFALERLYTEPPAKPAPKPRPKR